MISSSALDTGERIFTFPLVSMEESSPVIWFPSLRLTTAWAHRADGELSMKQVQRTLVRSGRILLKLGVPHIE